MGATKWGVRDTGVQFLAVADRLAEERARDRIRRALSGKVAGLNEDVERWTPPADPAWRSSWLFGCEMEDAYGT